MSAEARINQRWASDEIQIRTDRGFVSSEFDARSIHETDGRKLMLVFYGERERLRAQTPWLLIAMIVVWVVGLAGCWLTRLLANDSVNTV